MRVLPSILLVALLGASTASAVLMEDDLVPGSGDGLLTVDTDTGLVWLDLTETLGLSVNQMLGGALPNGFRYATFDEVCALVAAGGDCFAADSQDSVEVARMVMLQMLIGVTGGGGPGDNQSNTDGYYTFQDGSFTQGGVRTTPSPLVTAIERRYRLDGFGFPPDDSSSPTVGHWLVQLPEPASSLLSSFALGAVVILRANSSRHAARSGRAGRGCRRFRA